MNFHESLAYLYRLGNEVLAMKLGLASTEKLLAALGDRQNNFLKVQVAGTNGKGSTCAFLDSICRAAGMKTGLYTSPHLISITERIKIGGEQISETTFARHATSVKETAERLVEAGELEAAPTFFEQMTAIAVSAFAEAKIEFAILETGLGGRFDSVTATRAEIAAITPIDYDHQQILGETLAEIAAEKAAIIRRDTRRVLIAPQRSEAENVIRGRCREVGVAPVWAIPEVKIHENSGADLLYLSFLTPHGNYQANLQMRGRHQWTNANLAIRIAETLRDFGYKITRENIETGVAGATHKGRLEFYKGILFDGAHNPAGAIALRAYLDEFVRQPLTMIFGAMRDKDLKEIGAALFPRAANLIFTEPDNPRSLETEELMKFLPEDFDKNNVYTTPTVADALDLAAQIAPENLICVTGSLYLVGEAQEILQNAF